MKKRGIRRLFLVLLALVVIVGTINLPMNVKEARADGPGQQQIGASSAYWEVIDGVLYITGSGNLPDYSAISNQPWYSVRDSITSISIAPGITGLGKNNFDGLRNVTSISVPDSVTSIGQYCFQNTGIESVVINGSNITINGYAFANCKNLKNVSFSGEVHYDHDGAFYKCENLEAVTFGSINRLGQRDFYNCTKLEKIVINNIPDGFTIHERLFGDGVAGIPANLYIVIPDGKSIADLGISDLNLRSALCGKVVTQSQYDAWKVGDEKITQRNHDFDENTVFTKIDKNTHQWTCSTCGGVAQGNHDFSAQPYFSDDAGKHYQKCKLCGAESTHETHVEGTAVKENEVASTCTKKGTYDEVVYCSVCKVELSRTLKDIDMKAHTTVTDKAVAATCTEKGKTEGSHCSVCNTVLVAQKEVEPKGHTSVVDKAVAATCETAGKTEGSHCSVCEKVLVAQKDVEATGHKYDDGKVTKEPTTSVEGVKTYTCSVCGKAKTEAIAKLPEEQKPEVKPEEQKPVEKTLEEQAEEIRVEQVTSFVSRMYTVALNRDFDEKGLEDWSTQLLEHKINGAGIARGFIESKEFKSKNLKDEEFVDVLYETFFDRKADPGGKEYWLKNLKEGKSREFVLAGFVNSKEFDNLSEKFGIIRGYMYPDGKVADAGIFQFAERMYTKALGRKAEKKGLDDWSMRIITGKMKPVDVAKSFFNSKEFLDKNLSNADYVEVLYQTFMDRASDKAGKASWVAKLDKKEMTRGQVLDGFANSKEFQNILKSFGL